MKTLFDEIGGEEAIDLFVEQFYQKVMDDPRVNHFFEGMNMRTQKRHQAFFLTYAFGGLPFNPGRSLREAHQELVEEENLGDVHFDAIVEHIQNTLTDLNVATDNVEKVVSLVEQTRHEILNR